MFNSADKEIFRKRLAELAGSSLGLDIFPRLNWFSWRPAPLAEDESCFWDGLKMIAKYAVSFCLFPWVIFYLFPWIIGYRDGKWFENEVKFLYLLQLYGALWAGWATTTTGLTTRALHRTINTYIIPYISPAAIATISAELEKKLDRRKFLIISWCVGITSAAVAGFLVNHDVDYRIGSLEILVWALGWAVLYTTATAVVNIASFYSVFAKNLDKDALKLFKISPAQSSLFSSVASLGNILLSFWFGIAISIAIAIPFLFIDRNSASNSLSFTIHFFPSKNAFVLAHVIVTSLLAVGIGAIVFTRSDVALRQAARLATNSTLRWIEHEMALLSRVSSLDEADWKQLLALKDLHKDVVAGGSYRSALLSGLSLVMPLIAPLLSLLPKILEKTK